MKRDQDKEPVETTSRGDAPPATPVSNSTEDNSSLKSDSEKENEEYTDVLESGLGIDE